MDTWWYMWRMIRYRPWLYLINGVLWTLIHLFPLLPGLIAREFFNTLEGQAGFGLGTWGLIALLLATALAQIMLIFAGGLTVTSSVAVFLLETTAVFVTVCFGRGVTDFVVVCSTTD